MALVRGTPQLLVETDADGGLGFESRDGRSVAVVTRDNLALKLADIGSPFKFPNFKKSLLPSLVAGATASRSAGVVTIAATAHGITTGSTYQGFRVFYPGSPGLAAGWYDAILSVPDANTLTFSAPGPDFGSESINGGAPWLTLADVASVIIPPNLLADGSRVTIHGFRNGDTSSAVKTIRVYQNGLNMSTGTVTTFPTSIFSNSFFIGQNGTRAVGCGASDLAVTTTEYLQVTDTQAEIVVAVRGSVSAASAFLAIQHLICKVEI